MNANAQFHEKSKVQKCCVDRESAKHGGGGGVAHGLQSEGHPSMHGVQEGPMDKATNLAFPGSPEL